MLVNAFKRLLLTESRNLDFSQFNVRRLSFRHRQIKLRPWLTHISILAMPEGIALKRLFPEVIVLTTKPRIDAYTFSLHESETWW